MTQVIPRVLEALHQEPRMKAKYVFYYTTHSLLFEVISSALKLCRNARLMKSCLLVERKGISFQGLGPVCAKLCQQT